MNVGVLRDFTFTDFKSLISSEVVGYYSDAALQHIFESTKNTARTSSIRSGFSATTLSDLVAPLLQFKSEPNGPDGVRLLTTMAGSKLPPIYLINESGQCKMLDIDSHPALLAFHAFNLVSANPTEERLTSARQILDWVREVVKPAGGDDPLASQPFTRFWTKGQKGSGEEIKLAAATIAISANSAPAMLAVLEPALKGHFDTDKLAALKVAFVRASISVGDSVSLTKAEPVARALTQEFSSSAEAAALYIRLLVKLNKLGDAEAFGSKFAGAQPDDLTVARLVINCYQQQKRFKEASDLLQKLVANERSVPGDVNSYGWNAVLGDTVTPEILETVQRTANSNAQNISLIHTLAMMYASAGRGRDARSVAAQAITGWGLAEPNSEIWLVYARIAQSYGLNDAARSAYQKVEQPLPGEPFFNMTSYALAQDELRALPR